MTTVVGAVRRPGLNYQSFADLTDVPVERDGIARSGITFAGDLSPEEVEDVRLRIESTDDVDQARRADLRAKRDAVIAGPTLENVAALVVAEANYQLGD